MVMTFIRSESCHGDIMEFYSFEVHKPKSVFYFDFFKQHVYYNFRRLIMFHFLFKKKGEKVFLETFLFQVKEFFTVKN